jgi:hypothetical protein
MKMPRHSAWTAALGLAAAACQPLPHPFADDRPPAALLNVRDSSGVSIGPVRGTPPATARKLASALAAALLKHDIPASDRTASLGSYLLDGRIEESPAGHGRSVVTAFWRLRAAGGQLVGERTQELEAPSAKWRNGDGIAIAELASASADALTPLLVDQAPTPAEGGDGAIRVLIRGVSGAPGDGDHSLVAALRTVLKSRDIAVIDKPGERPDRIVDGEVAISAASKTGAQHVKIVWHVRRPDGGEIGNVAQENDVPTGSLDAAWGDVAYSVAVAAESGIAAILARVEPQSSPARTIRSDTPADAAPAPGGKS